MSDVLNPVFVVEDHRGTFFCPACNKPHTINIGLPDSWDWNENTTEVTLSPSVLVSSGHYLPGGDHSNSCWCTYYKNNPGEEVHFTCGKCHSFIKNGFISYLEDCSHDFKGQTLKLNPYPTGAL